MFVMHHVVGFVAEVHVEFVVDNFVALAIKCGVEELLYVSVDVVGVFEGYPQEVVVVACY